MEFNCGSVAGRKDGAIREFDLDGWECCCLVDAGSISGKVVGRAASVKEGNGWCWFGGGCGRMESGSEMMD